MQKHVGRKIKLSTLREEKRVTHCCKLGVWITIPFVERGDDIAGRHKKLQNDETA